VPSANRITDRYAQISVLAASARNLIERGTWPMLLLLGGAEALLVFKSHPGAAAFALIALSSLIVLGAWKGAGKGLPIVPMLALQTLIAYGLPIINNNETILLYKEEAITAAGFEILIFSLSLAGFWRLGMQVIATAPATCYALQGFEEEGTGQLSRIGLTLIGSAASFELLQSVQLLDPLLSILPSGAISIINVLLSAVGACGFFLVGMLVGRGSSSSSLRLMFWVCLGLHCFISASAFLLSSTITIVFSALIGLFWGSGRVPWRVITTIFVVLSFFNLGKFTMRERYWHPGESDPIPQFALSEMPGHYVEWIEASIDTLSTQDTRRNDSADKARKSQSLSERINNLQNLLYVIDAVGPGRIAPLGGATYILIPPLLVPRIIWPDKPRTHEGQVMLNVHFGRQDLNSTFSTYVAWGLQAEAYGNFGPVAGSIFIGACLGLFFAWVEQMTTRKILLSLEGFLSFTLFLGMANSFEMVASVLVTSIFQAFIPIVFACMPFVRRVTPTPPVVPSGETTVS
jgi:hypothetical protein